MPNRSANAIIVYTGDDCTIQVPNEVWWYNELKKAFKDGAPVTIEVKSRRKPRSLKANAYFHLCLQIVADETGNDLETVKNTIKTLYAKKPLLDKDGEPIIDKATGEVAFYIQDTRDMSSVELMNLQANLATFALDFLGIVLPQPDEQIDIKF